MNQQLARELQSELNNLERDLSENLRSQKEQYDELAHSERIEPGDEAQVRMQSNNRGAMMYHDEERLTRVRSALARIEEGNYGTCVTCGTEIDEGRLKAKPESEFCIECEKRHEQQESRPIT